MQKDFLEVIGLSWGLDPKRSGTELTMANLMDLESNGGAKLQNFIDSSHPIFRCTSPLERTIKKQRRRKDNNTFHSKWWQCSVAPTNGHLHQSAQSLRSSSGFDWRITRWSKSSRETCCIGSDGTRNSYSASSCRSASQWWATGKPIALLRAVIWKKKLPEDQKLSQLCSETCLNMVEGGQFFFALPSPRGQANQSLCREIHCFEIKKELKQKEWLQSNVRFGPVSDIFRWSPSSIFVQGSNRILDEDCERYWQTCQRSHTDQRGRESFGETRCKSKTFEQF